MKNTYKTYVILVFTTLLGLCLSAELYAQRPKRILFIGNSFIAANDLPAIVSQMADRAGLPMEHEAYTPGGATVKYIPHGTRAHANNPDVYTLIRSRKWDYIVVQDNQGFFVNPVIGDYSSRSLTVEGHIQLRDSLHATNICGRLLLFAGWVDKDPYAWEPSLGLYSAEEANQRIYDQYKYLNDRHLNEILSPIGIAWNRVMAALPALNLFAADNYHPSYEGSYVTAATLFTVIFGRSPEESDFNGSLSPADAAVIKRIAYEVVTDSLHPTGMAAYSPKLVRTGGMLRTDAVYLSYEWYEDNRLMPGIDVPEIPAIEGKCYQVKVITPSGCEWWSLKSCFTEETDEEDPDDPTLVAEKTSVANSIAIAPNPVADRLQIRHQGLRLLQLSDFAGRILYTTSNQIHELDMRDLVPGVYLLKIAKADGQMFMEKIIKQ